MDAVKHTGGTMLAVGGWLSSISLARVNEYGSCLCWILGSVAALCTINSWWKSRRRKKH